MLLLLSFAALIITPIVQGVLRVSSHGAGGGGGARGGSKKTENSGEEPFKG